MPRRALLSVSDKTNIVSVAQKLINMGFEIISTGGTAKTLTEAGVAVTTVEDVTGFPECFSGRVKTMHPLLMGGILYKRNDKDHVKQAKEHAIAPIDIVIVNLYPFAKTLQKGETDGRLDDPTFHEEVTEQIDIGGPTLLRSAAKNHENVTVVCDPADYDSVLKAIEKDGDTSVVLRRELAAKVFLHTAAYDALITKYLSKNANDGILMEHGTTLRYGENPHQVGKFFKIHSADHANAWRLHQGKALSYLNILDADAAWAAVQEFAHPTAVLVKHANPSGIASHDSIDEAFQRAYDADRLSAFGVIIAINRPCTATIAQKILDQKIFVEVVVAPSYEPEALKLFTQKPNVRIVECHLPRNGGKLLYRSALDGILVQNEDTKAITEKDLTTVTKKKLTPEQIQDLLFAWKVVKYAKSNAIVLAKNLTTVGIGAGQTSRVDSTWIAAKRAGEKAKGSVLASDAFFPFPDSLQEAAKVGISAVIQPGGSVKDAEVFAEADKLGLAMVLTGVRAFRH